MAPGPLAPSGENGVKAGSGGGAFGSQVDLTSATEGLSISGNRPQTLPPVAETPAKDATVCCGAVMERCRMAPHVAGALCLLNQLQLSAACVQAPAEPPNEMDHLKAVLARTKAAQAKYARYSQEQVRLQGSTAVPACRQCVSTLALRREESCWLRRRAELLLARPWSLYQQRRCRWLLTHCALARWHMPWESLFHAWNHAASVARPQHALMPWPVV